MLSPGSALVSILLLSAAPVAPQIELRHQDRAGGAFVLESVSYVLDGRPLLAIERGAAEDKRRDELWLRRKIDDGTRIAAVKLVYRGNFPLMPYSNEYRFVMRARMIFDAAPGSVYEITTRIREHADAFKAWDEKLLFEAEGTPRKAFSSIEIVSMEKVKGPTDEVLLEISADEQRRLDEKAEEAIREVMARAAPPKPPPPPPAPEPEPAIDETGGLAVADAPCEGRPLSFDTADAALSAASLPELTRLAQCLISRPQQRMRIEGHCDVRGSAAFNRGLGLQRALAAARVLQKGGVARSRLVVVSRGESAPVCDEDTAECHARNRRVLLTAVGR